MHFGTFHVLMNDVFIYIWGMVIIAMSPSADMLGIFKRFLRMLSVDMCYDDASANLLSE